MLDFQSGMVYFHAMTFFTNKLKLGIWGIAVLVFYLLALVLSPLFHLHPEVHHPGSAGNGYHSHTEPFASHTSEHSAEDNQEEATPDHFGETLVLFKDIVGVVQVSQSNTLNPAKFSPVLLLFIHSSAESCASQPTRKISFNLLPLQPQQDYCVQTATNLSPPQA